MNVSLDTLEIHRLELPGWPNQLNPLIALLTVAMGVYVITTIAHLVWTLRTPPAPAAAPYIEVNGDCEL